MAQAQARALLADERARLQRLLQAETGKPEAVEEAEDAAGLVSADHPFEVLADADITPEEEQASEEDDDEPTPSQAWASTSSPTTRPHSPVNGDA